MRVFVSGGTGFVGRALCRALLEGGHRVSLLTRSAPAARDLPPQVEIIEGDPTRPGPWQQAVAGHQGVVNLAGASIFGRWTRSYQELILSSRVLTTRHLVQALADRPAGKDAVLVSASAVGYYGFQDQRRLHESDPAGDDFLARVCRRWEKEALAARESGVRVVTARLGIVLGPGGGALARMLPGFRLGLGGPLGSGRQWFSWIHIQDLVRALIFCLEHPGLDRPVNCTAPEPVTNRELARTLGRVLGRPAFLTLPGPLLRLVMGKMGSVLLEGQRVLPRALQEAGFVFSFPTLEPALVHILSLASRDPRGA